MKFSAKSEVGIEKRVLVAKSQIPVQGKRSPVDEQNLQPDKKQWLKLKSC